MHRLDLLFVVIGFAICAGIWIVSQMEAWGGGRPLDLPSGGHGIGIQEDDAAETITFYGGDYEGDGFFWCLDKSCSMGWSDAISQLKSEVIYSLSQLSSGSEFSMVAFSTGHIMFSPIPRVANAANRGAAITWVNALVADGTTCMGPAGVETIEIANLCSQENRQILILSDGIPSCTEGSNDSAVTLSTITGANWQRIPINTIYVSNDAGGVAFMQQLAALNGGSFSQPPG